MTGNNILIGQNSKFRLSRSTSLVGLLLVYSSTGAVNLGFITVYFAEQCQNKQDTGNRDTVEDTFSEETLG